ncbi:hypothetical protein C0416_00290 [bacterium]|nr:hypothetical protein [bacterium]
MNINKTQKGSALIIAFLIMGILMTLALGLSNLVIREVRITNDIINSGKAYYAAESGIESALLDLNQNLPGYETEGGMYKGIYGDFKLDEDLTFEYSIENRTHTYPYVDTEIINKEIAQDSPKQYQYNVLDLSESISVPLFTVGEDGDILEIKNFRIEFFIDAEVAPQYSAAVTNLYIDMLRWKITGIKTSDAPDGKSFYTESIGDYMPVFVGSTPTKPTCLGTAESSGSFKDPDSEIIYNGTCNGSLWEWARESYVFEFDPITLTYTTQSKIWDPLDPTQSDPIMISQFLSGHKTNYLTLTNIFNPDVLQEKPGVTKEQQAKIYYRIIVPNEEIIREFAKIKSTGSYGKLRQQIEAFIRPEGFLPVFNFSLYRTDVTEKSKENPAGFTPSS